MPHYRPVNSPNHNKFSSWNNSRQSSLVFISSHQGTIRPWLQLISHRSSANRNSDSKEELEEPWDWVFTGYVYAPFSQQWSARGCDSEIITPGSTVWREAAVGPSMRSCTQAPGIYCCCRIRRSCCQTAFEILATSPIDLAALLFSRGRLLKQRFITGWNVENMLSWVFSLKSSIYRTPFPTNRGNIPKEGTKRMSELRTESARTFGHDTAACNHEVTAADYFNGIWARPSYSKF